MKHLQSLCTPCLLVDLDRVEQNIARMHKHVNRLGVPLRPHVKTCKSAKIAKLMLAGQMGGIAVSTLAEAEYFLSHGITDIIYAICIAPGKLDQVADLMGRGGDIKLLLDNVDAAQLVAQVGAQKGIAFKVLVEIDTDGHRAGIKPENPALLEIGKVLQGAKGTEFCGVLTHAGGSYDCGDIDAIIAVAEQERTGILRAVDTLAAAGFRCNIVSLGSTPTASFAKSMSGITDVRAGVFVFYDLFQAALGVCDLDDLALMVVSEVIGRDLSAGRIFIDAGALALSKDRSTQKASEDMGFGLVTALGQKPSQGKLVVKQVFQEHGIVAGRGEKADVSNFQIGDKVLVWPNHACMTAAAHSFYHLQRGEKLVGQWPRINGW